MISFYADTAILAASLSLSSFVHRAPRYLSPALHVFEKYRSFTVAGSTQSHTVSYTSGILYTISAFGVVQLFSTHLNDKRTVSWKLESVDGALSVDQPATRPHFS